MTARKPPSPAPEAELEVLAVLHEQGEADAMQVREALKPRRAISHATVSTLLRRLESRGLVKRRKADRGKSYLYAPSEEAMTTHRRLLRRLLERVFRNDSLSLVSALFSVKPPTKTEARELRKLVDSLHGRRRK
ncbi:MAG: BlaI/MecI/CopY family transcriptional regulator [Thermoanaerobaculia bacterium]